LSDSIGTLLLVQVILIALNAVFASAEIAVLSTNEAKIERLAEQGNKKGKRLFKLTREPAKFLSTIQIAITLSGFLGSAFAAEGFSDPLVEWLISIGVTIPRQTLNTIAVIVITIILSYFTLVFGELVPKRIAMKKSEQLALAISGLISAISVLFKPIVWVLSVSTNGILRLFGIDPNEDEVGVSEEEIRMMVETGGEKGAIDKDEQNFIENVFKFDDLTAGEILTHRTDVAILWLEDNDDAWSHTIHDSRFTRYPICDESPDKVIGVLNAKDYFRLEDRSRQNIMATAVEQPYFVPETIKADLLFSNMRKAHKSMAIVLDEYGGMMGIVTLSDLLEELVGELDEIDQRDENPRIEKIDENTWRVYGNIELSDLEEALETEIEAEDVNTFTGFVFDLLNGIPNDGDHNIEVKVQDLTIYIKRIYEHQIVLADIVREKQDEKADETQESSK
jgi:putative hemolysin